MAHIDEVPPGLSKSQLLRRLEQDLEKAEKWASTPTGQAILKRQKIRATLAWREWVAGRQKLREERLRAYLESSENQNRNSQNDSGKTKKTQPSKNNRQRGEGGTSRLRRLAKMPYYGEEESSGEESGSGSQLTESDSESEEESDNDDTDDEEGNPYEEADDTEMNDWVVREGDPFAHSSQEYIKGDDSSASAVLEYIDDAEDELDSASDSASEPEDMEDAELIIPCEEVADLE